MSTTSINTSTLGSMPNKLKNKTYKAIGISEKMSSLLLKPKLKVALLKPCSDKTQYNKILNQGKCITYE